MATIFSSDSKTPGWSRAVHLVGLIALMVGGFFGLMFLWCNIFFAMAGAWAAMLVAFFSIQRGATELGKWGRFKSNSVVWLMFFLALISTGFLAASSVYMLAYDDHWRNNEADLRQGIEDGISIVDEYGILRQAYLDNVAKRLATAQSTQFLGGNPTYVKNCPYLLTGRLTESAIDARLNVLRSDLNASDSSVIQQLKAQGDTLLVAFTEVGFAQRCMFPQKIFDFQSGIIALESIFKSKIANVECDSGLLNPAQGQWLTKTSALAGSIDSGRSSWDFRVILSDIKLHYSVLAIFIFALTFSPLFTTRGTLGGSSRKSETEL